MLQSFRRFVNVGFLKAFQNTSCLAARFNSKSFKTPCDKALESLFILEKVSHDSQVGRVASTKLDDALNNLYDYREGLSVLCVALRSYALVGPETQTLIKEKIKFFLAGLELKQDGSGFSGNWFRESYKQLGIRLEPDENTTAILFSFILNASDDDKTKEMVRDMWDSLYPDMSSDLMEALLKEDAERKAAMTESSPSMENKPG